MQAGKRTDLEGMQALVNEGLSYAELWETNFPIMVKYHKAIAVYTDLKRGRTRLPPRIVVLFGFPGTGKTRFVFEKEPDLFNHMGGSWFDGYDGQSAALFDEFDGSDMPFCMWKKVVDRYPLRVTIKGSSANWSPDTIYFTSNFHPKQWWAKTTKSRDYWTQFTRRITECREYLEDGSIIDCDLTQYNF